MKLIDISMTLREGMMTFPVAWHPSVEVTQLGRFEVEGRETRKITLGTHTGTHVDAPRHFVPGGKTIEHVDLDKFFGKAMLLDFTDLPDKAEISSDMIKAKLGSSDIKFLIFRFDWDERLDSLKYYSEHPYLSEEAAQYLVDRGTVLVGFDSPMPDNPQNGRGSGNDSPNHTILLGGEVVILEYLCNLKQIDSKEFVLSAFPLKIKDGDGAPVRAVAIIE